MAADANATTAMTIDFLRARLLSERSVSRAAKERADQLAKRVAELEEQLRTVTTQRRKAERAAAEVLAILETQGFGRLSDAADSGSDDDTGGPGAAESGNGGKGRGEVEDALSGSELEGTAAAPQAGGLSWKGRAASPDSERRQPHRGRQLRQRHNHSLRKSYFYLLTADSSPKYQLGQSCRKIKRKELRLQTEGDGGMDNATESPEEQERSDCTVCTDEQHDFDGEVSQDARGSCGDGSVEDGNDSYTMEYQKNGEMERVLEKQAELIGQYEAEETAQREWERKFSGSRDSTVDDVDLDNKLNQNEKASKERGKAAQFMDREVVCEEARSSNGEMHVRKDELVNKSYSEIDEGSGNILGRSAPSPQTNYNTSPNAVHNRCQGDGNSDTGSSYHANARSYEQYITNISVGSPLSDTPRSKISEWSSSCFHNHTDNQIETQLYQPSNDDVEGVLEALQRAKMSLREKLSRLSPPSQDMLALPAPGDCYTKDDLPVNDTELSLCVSRRLSQEILALPASGNYLSRINLPRNDAKVPVGPAGLFRLPTDSFPQNKVCSTDGYGARFSLTAGQTSSVSQYGSGFSLNPYYDPRSSDCTTGDASFIPEILRSSNDSRRGMPSGDAGMLFQYGSAYN